MTGAPPAGAEAFAQPYFAARTDLDAYDTFATLRLGRSRLLAAHFRRDKPDLGITMPNERSDVAMAVVNLRPQGGNELWCEGSHARRASMDRGSLAVLDHRAAWTTVIAEPFETVHIFIPTKDLIELSDEIGGAPIDSLDCPISEERHDPVMLHLALSLLPAIQNPHEVSTLFADHIFGAIRAHMAVNYGGLTLPEERYQGGLTPWQQRIVRDLLLEDLNADSTLSGLANACGVSTRHFSRAFKATHGTPPHRWLLQQRVERAKQLLENSSLGISEIAQLCGFADQSHLTRIFHGHVGAPPAAWRRARRH